MFLHVAEYSYIYNINYDFKKLAVELKGTGGQAIISAENHLQFIDFGTCRLDRVFKKQITLTNSGNLGVNFIMRPEPSNKDWSIYDFDIENLNQKHQESRPSSGADSKSVQNLDSTIESVEMPWVKALAAQGFRMPHPSSFSAPYRKTDMQIEFKPTVEKETIVKLRIFVEGGFSEEFEIRGRAVRYHKINFRQNLSSQSIQQEIHYHQIKQTLKLYRRRMKRTRLFPRSILASILFIRKTPSIFSL
jgi:hypothetical protein